jgi:hypothetical protein
MVKLLCKTNGIVFARITMIKIKAFLMLVSRRLGIALENLIVTLLSYCPLEFFHQ